MLRSAYVCVSHSVLQTPNLIWKHIPVISNSSCHTHAHTRIACSRQLLSIHLHSLRFEMYKILLFSPEEKIACVYVPLASSKHIQNATNICQSNVIKRKFSHFSSSFVSSQSKLSNRLKSFRCCVFKTIKSLCLCSHCLSFY